MVGPRPRVLLTLPLIVCMFSFGVPELRIANSSLLSSANKPRSHICAFLRHLDTTNMTLVIGPQTEQRACAARVGTHVYKYTYLLHGAESFLRS